MALERRALAVVLGDFCVPAALHDLEQQNATLTACCRTLETRLEDSRVEVQRLRDEVASLNADIWTVYGAGFQDAAQVRLQRRRARFWKRVCAQRRWQVERLADMCPDAAFATVLRDVALGWHNNYEVPP